MTPHLIDLICDFAGLLAGGVIGSAFGALQQSALRRNEARERNGKLKNGWTLMPGAGARVAYLLVTLAAVQVFSPRLFADGTQWWVSAGVVVGYGVILFLGLRRKMAAVPSA